MPAKQVNSRAAVAVAIRSGKLRKKPCEVCGSCNTEAHHPDYARPLHVRWLCHKHHTQVHRALRKQGKVPKNHDLKGFIQLSVDRRSYNSIKRIAENDDRTINNMIGLLLHRFVRGFRKRNSGERVVDFLDRKLS